MNRICSIAECQTGCYGKSEYCRRHFRQKVEGALYTEPRDCKSCGERLPISFRPDRLFCSKPCQMKYHRKQGCYTKDRMLSTRGKCTIAKCERPIHAHKLCQIHANNLYRNGDPLGTRKKERGICTITNCKRVHLANGFCRLHYHSNREYGDPLFIEKKRALEQEAVKKPEYKRWLNMKSRCNNPKAGNYWLYGEKGIKVCDEWANDFYKFYADVGPIPGPSADYHLSRIDHNKGYEPGNVRWLSASENSRYHSGVGMSYEVANEIRCLYPAELTMQQLADRYNVTIGHISRIITNDVWVDENYAPPQNRRKSKFNAEQKSRIKLLRQQGYTLKKIAEIFDASEGAIHSITRNGYRGEKNAHPLFHVWQGMMRRCYELTNTSYRNYGAKGVTVYTTWHDFNAFIRDMPPRPSKEYSLDRIDPTGNYEPSNVKWATSSEQNKNKRNNKSSIKELDMALPL